MEAENRMTTWRVFFRFARPYRGQFTVVALLAFLGTAAELTEPLIYRIAVNDVAGVFVRRATEQPRDPNSPTPHVAVDLFSRILPTSSHILPVQQGLERNRAERTPEVGKSPLKSHSITKLHRGTTQDRHRRGR